MKEYFKVRNKCYKSRVQFLKQIRRFQEAYGNSHYSSDVHQRTQASTVERTTRLLLSM
jgi:hypothetical protein